VININYTFYLAPFPRYKERYCLQQVQNRYILATPLAFNLRRRDYPGTISVKFLPKGQRWPRYRNVVETLPKISIAWLGCTNVLDRQTDDRRTDGRWWHIANVNVSVCRQGRISWSSFTKIDTDVRTPKSWGLRWHHLLSILPRKTPILGQEVLKIDANINNPCKY